MLTLAATSLPSGLTLHCSSPSAPPVTGLPAAIRKCPVWWQCQRLRSGVTGAERVSNSPAVNGSELRGQPWPLELAPSHRHKDLAQNLRASANSAEPVVGDLGFFRSTYNLCALLLRHSPASLPSSSPRLRGCIFHSQNEVGSAHSSFPFFPSGVT